MVTGMFDQYLEFSKISVLLSSDLSECGFVNEGLLLKCQS